MKRPPVHAAFNETTAELLDTAGLWLAHYKGAVAELTHKDTPQARMDFMAQFYCQHEKYHHDS